MKHFYITLTLIIIFYSAAAFSIEYEDWTIQQGSNGTDWNRDMVTDSEGNCYLTGYAGGAIHTSVSGFGNYDLYILKYDINGNFVWAAQTGTSVSDGGVGIALDSNGNIYVVGWSDSSSINGQTSNGGKDILIVKYDPDGNLLWTRLHGGSSDELALACTVDDSDDLWLSGRTLGSFDGHTHQGGSDIFLVKYDSSGNHLLSEFWGTPGSENVLGMDSWNGEIAIGGFTAGSLGASIKGANDFVVIKYVESDTSQNFIFQDGTSSNDEFWDAEFDPSGNIYGSGRSAGTYHWMSNPGGDDAYLVKIDNSGNYQWARSIYTSGNDRGARAIIHSDGSVYFTGSATGDLDGMSNPGNESVFIQRYNPAGNKEWSYLFGSSSLDQGRGIGTAKNYLFISSWTDGLMGSSNPGGRDAVVSRFENIVQLNYTGESGYVSDGVDPDQGVIGNTFSFRVKYEDYLDLAPNGLEPVLHLLKGGVEVKGSPFTMDEDNTGDTVYSDGKIYTYDIAISTAGSDYTHYFTTQDENLYTATGEAIYPATGPEVIGSFISGTVTDGTDPIEGETVYLTGDLTSTDTTTASGDYTFTGISIGDTYYISIDPGVYYYSTPDSYTFISFDSSYDTADFVISISPIETPANLISSNITDTSAELIWDDMSDNEDGFIVERMAYSETEYSTVADLGDGATYYLDDTLMPDTTYYFRVFAYNYLTDSGYSNVVSFKTDVPEIILAPSDLTVTNSNSGSVDLSWTDNSDNEDGFKIERMSHSETEYSVIDTVGADVSVYTDPTLSGGSTYYFRVFAYNLHTESERSNSVSLTTPDRLFSDRVLWKQDLVSGDLELGDMNGDGHLDIVVTGYDNGVRTYIYQNEGSGNFTEITGGSFKSCYNVSMELVDFNNDGDLEIFVLGDEMTDPSNCWQIYAHDGSGGLSLYQESSYMKNGFNGTFSAKGDLNCDGFTDVLIGYDNGEIWDTHILLCSSSGYLSDSGSIGDYAWGDGEIFDADGDGSDDILISAPDSSEDIRVTRLYLNDGAGNFTESGSNQFTQMACQDIIKGDIDNDGDIDIILCGNDDSSVKHSDIYRNDGGGVFTEINETDIEPTGFYSGQMIDINMDGNLDLLLTGKQVVSPYDPLNSIYYGDGTGGFDHAADNELDNPGTADFLIQLADLNGDNRPDAVFMGNNYLESFHNLIPTINSAPGEVSGMGVQDNGGFWEITWTHASDDHTPSGVMNYQIAISDDGTDFNIASEALSYPRGNADLGDAHGVSSYLTKVPVTSDIYYSIRSIDSSFITSNWAYEFGPVDIYATDLNTVKFSFSQGSNTSTSGNASNYSIYESSTPSNTITVNSATVKGDKINVVLDCGTLTPGVVYTLESSASIQDGLGRALNSNSQIEFTAPYNLSSSNNPVYYPEWSNDGTKIAYIEYDYLEEYSNIFIQNRDGSGKMQVTDHYDETFHGAGLSFSPDDTDIIFTALDTWSDYSLLKKVPVTGGSVTLMHPPSATNWGRWYGPDWASSLNQVSGTEMVACCISGEIWVFDPADICNDSSSLIRLTSLTTSYNDTYAYSDKIYNVKWSPDNTQLTFALREAGEGVQNSDIYVLDNVQNYIGAETSVSTLSDTDIIQITDDPYPTWCPSFSRDGSKISYFSDSAGTFDNIAFQTGPDLNNFSNESNFDCYFMSADGTGSQEILEAELRNEGFMKWAPAGGDQFIYVAMDYGVSEADYLLNVINHPVTAGFSKSGLLEVRDYSLSGAKIDINDCPITELTIESPVSLPSIPKGYTGEARYFTSNQFDDISLSGEVYIHFTDASVGRIEKSNLGIKYYDRYTNTWEPLRSSVTPDDLGGIVSAEINTLGYYAVCVPESKAVTAGEIRIFPNPANKGETLRFELSSYPEYVAVYNIAGERVADMSSIIELTSDVYSFDISELSSGIYIIVAKADGVAVKKKFAIIK